MKSLFARKKTGAENLPILHFVFVVLGLGVIIVLPYQFRSEARKVDFRQTMSYEDNLEDYDIRTDKTQAETLINFRASSNINVVQIADAKDRFIRAENMLRQKIPTLKIEYNNDLGTPEIIAPDVKQGRAFLSASSKDERLDILRSFIKQNNDLLGVDSNQTDELKLASDYTNPDGNLSFSSFRQEINGVPVFRGEIKAGFTKNGELIRIVNNLAPGLDYKNLSTDFGNPRDAVFHAASYINHQLKTNEVLRNEAVSSDLKTVFGTSDWATTAKKNYFPIEPGVARAAWRVLIWEKVNA